MKFLKINKLSILGFGKHVEIAEFHFSDFTKILGENEEGKTTIGKAITWGFLGSDLFGNERADSDLVNKKAKITEIEIDFTTQDGDHELIRRRKGNKTDIYLDDEKVTNLEVRQLVGEKDIFLTIFNPEYFPSKQPKDAKEFLNSTLGTIKNEEVFAEMGEYEKDLLIENKFKNPNLFLEDKRADLKEIDEDLIYIDGFINGKKIDEEIPEEKYFDDTKLKELKSKLEKLENIKPLHDIQSLKTKKSEIEREIFKLENSNNETDTKDIENKLTKLALEKQYPKIQQPELIDVKTLESERSLLVKEYKPLVGQLKNLNSKLKCNKCGSEIDWIKNEKTTIEIRMKEVEVEGISVNEQIEKGTESNRLANEKYQEELSNYNTKIENEIKNLEKELQAEETKNAKSKRDRVDKIAELRKEVASLGIEALEKENLEHEENNRLKKNGIKEEIKLLEQAEYAIKLGNEARLKSIKAIEENREEIKKAKEKLELQKKRKDEINQQIDAAKLFNSKKLEIQTKKIEKHLDKVTIKLQEMVKSTGELKDTFKIMYKGEEFNVLSRSEKIKVGLEIADLVMNVLKIRLPIFLDNKESITNYNKPDTQIIEAKVVEDAPLTVEV